MVSTDDLLVVLLELLVKSYMYMCLSKNTFLDPQDDLEQ